jgi:4'-phosphopantetheinyl transferase
VGIASAGRWYPRPNPPLGAHDVHVWRVPLDDARADAYAGLLSDDERRRAARFVRDVHRRRFIAAHGALRSILAGYVGAEPAALDFVSGEHGKPALRGATGRAAVEFNLSHSDDLALVAVARAHAVGVDLERWSEGVEYLELAERFFSPGERRALRALAHVPDLVEAGFFAAWTRKEAYLKATGHGITRGLHHFDVALAPGEPARLLADRLDADATARWTMFALDPAPGYSAALVAASPIGEVLQFTV